MGELVRTSVKLRPDQVRRLKLAVAEYPVTGVGQVTKSTVVSDLIDKFLGQHVKALKENQSDG